MKKFDLKKFIAENKATFHSSLREGDLMKSVGKGLEYEATEEMIRDYADRLLGAGVDDVEDLANYYLDNPEELPEPMEYEFFENNFDDILSLAMTGLDEGKKSKKYYKDAEADDAEHIKALEKDMKDDKKASKMKVSELKAKIKEMVLSEMELDVDSMEDAPESEVDFLAELEGMLGDEGDDLNYGDDPNYLGGDDHFFDTVMNTNLEDILAELKLEGGISLESLVKWIEDNWGKLTDEYEIGTALMKFKDEGFSLEHVVGWIEAHWNRINEGLKEADEKAAEEEAAADVTVDDTETTDVETTAEVNPNVKAVQDSLTQAQAAAQKLGDKKLIDQIGNTITFFTRTHVVEKPGAVAESIVPLLKKILK